MKRGMNIIIKCLSLCIMAVSLFVSCSVEDTDRNLNNPANAMQIANYQVLGSVSDEAGVGIAGVRVIADYSVDVVYRADTLYTDKEGRFSKFISIPRVDKFTMTFSDAEGKYEPRIESVVPVRTEISSGHFGGSYIVSIDVSLKRK